MIADLSEILKGYFSFSWEKHPEFERHLQSFYDNSATRITQIVSEDFKLKARIGHVWRNKNGRYDLVEYCGDREIIKTSDKKCLEPLHFLPDSNYFYYGCYLTIAAYLMRITPEKLLLYHGPGGNDLHSFKYQPQIASIFLRNRYNSLKAVSAENIENVPSNDFQPLFI